MSDQLRTELVKSARDKPKRDAKAIAMADPTPEPTERDLAIGREARERVLARRKRPRVVASPDTPNAFRSPHNDEATFLATIRDTFGTTAQAFVDRAIDQLSTAMKREGTDQVGSLNAGLAIVAGIQPENEIEAMLAIQMAATHEAALSMLAITRREGTEAAIQAAGGFAVKLLRTYTSQVEALARLRRRGEQTVRVEHVHVHPGAQAIVGNVNHGGGGGVIGNGDQPREPNPPEALAFAPGAPLWSEEPGGELMPSPGSERGETVLEARRGARKRRA